jgi:hypothetical protein
MKALYNLPLRTVLLVSGLATLAVLAEPSLVFFGFLLLILPGLFLSVMPMVFSYSAAFTLTRYGLRAKLTSEKRVSVLAALSVLAISILIGSIAQLDGYFRLRRYQLEDVPFGGKIPVSGDVLLDGQFGRGDCDGPCANLLRRSQVQSVSVSHRQTDRFEDLRDGNIGGAASRFGWARSDFCEEQRASDRSADRTACVLKLPPIARFDYTVRYGEWREWSGNSIFDEWRARRPVIAEFAEVRGGDRVIARAWAPSVDTLTIPLLAFPTCGGVYETVMCWSRSRLGAPPYSLGVATPSDLLDRWLNGPRKPWTAPRR